MIFFSVLSCWELYHKEGVSPKLQIVLVLSSAPQYHNIYNSAACESFHDWSSKYMRACHMGDHVQVHGGANLEREIAAARSCMIVKHKCLTNFLQQQRDFPIIQLHQELISHGDCLVFLAATTPDYSINGDSLIISANASFQFSMVLICPSKAWILIIGWCWMISFFTSFAGFNNFDLVFQNMNLGH